MSIKKTKNADIKYAKKDRLKDADFEPNNIGHRISIIIPEDVLMAYREQASDQRIGYQTLMNQVLRRNITDERSLGERLAILEKVFSEAALK